MFVEKVLFLALVGYVAAEVPSYIHVCGRRNPNVDKCILNSVQDLRENLRTGIPELEVPAADPLYVDRVVFMDTPSFKGTATNLKLLGLSDYQANLVHLDLDKQVIDIDVYFKEITIDAGYDVFARIVVPISGNGLIKVLARDINAKVKLTFKLADRGGKTYVYFPSMTTHLSVKDFDAKFDSQGSSNGPLVEAVNNALGNSHQDILDATVPNIEKAISEKALEIANKICKHFTFDELFPDRE